MLNSNKGKKQGRFKEAAYNLAMASDCNVTKAIPRGRCGTSSLCLLTSSNGAASWLL